MENTGNGWNFISSDTLLRLQFTPDDGTPYLKIKHLPASIHRFDPWECLIHQEINAASTDSLDCLIARRRAEIKFPEIFEEFYCTKINSLLYFPNFPIQHELLFDTILPLFWERNAYAIQKQGWIVETNQTIFQGNPGITIHHSDHLQVNVDDEGNVLP